MKLIVLTFSIFSIIQLLVYALKDIFKPVIPDWSILMLVFIGYFFVLPGFLYPEPRADGINCGMPILGITLACWLFGTIAALISHLVWTIGLKNVLTRKEDI